MLRVRVNLMSASFVRLCVYSSAVLYCVVGFELISFTCYKEWEGLLCRVVLMGRLWAVVYVCLLCASLMSRGVINS